MLAVLPVLNRQRIGGVAREHCTVMSGRGCALGIRLECWLSQRYAYAIHAQSPIVAIAEKSFAIANLASAELANRSTTA
jgi:hypothetical protein